MLRSFVMWSLAAVVALNAGPTSKALIGGQPSTKESIQVSPPPQTQDLSTLDPTVLQQRATQGDAIAQTELATRYFAGRGGVSQDYSQAYTWIRKAAEQGFADAEADLAELYFNGIGVPQDYAESLLWFSKAATQGNAEAEFYLGASYQYGRGITQDYAQAFKWYFKAASQGYPLAQLAVGYAYENGQGVFQKDYTLALQWYKKAADQGNANAEEHLGTMYRDGLGVPKTSAIARMWYQKAADQNDPDAKSLLANLDTLQQQAAQQEAAQKAAAQQQIQQAAEAAEDSKPVVLMPLPYIGSDLEKKVYNSDGKELYSYFENMHASCGFGQYDAKTAKDCFNLSRIFQQAIDSDHTSYHDWYRNHGLTDDVRAMADAARMRSCALGSPEGCSAYGATLASRGLTGQARGVWRSKPCQDFAGCKTQLEKSYSVANSATQTVLVLTSGDVPLYPLPAIPKDLQSKIVEEEPYPPHRPVLQSDIADCAATPGPTIPGSRVAMACNDLTAGMEKFLNYDHNLYKNWGSKHGYIELGQKLMDAARMRSCALGNAVGCAQYGVTLVALGRLDEARRVWTSTACGQDQQCKDNFTKSYVDEKEAAQAETKLKAQVAYWQAHPEDAPGASYQPKPSAFLSVMSAVNQGLETVTANADPNGIQDAANQGLNNINAVTARNQQLRDQTNQQAEPPRASISTAQPPAARTETASVDTGTAAPANCVYLSPSQPCVPLAQYQQMQAQQSTRISVETCPPSGFVPGLMRRTSSDTSEGVPCTPGQPIDPSLFASNGSTGSSSSASSGGSSASSGGPDTADPFDPDLISCIVPTYKNDPVTGDHLLLQNNCSIRAQVYFYASSQVHGGVALDPGEVDNTYAAYDQITAAGGVSLYACPIGDTPRQADGSLAYNGVNNHFRCSRK